MRHETHKWNAVKVAVEIVTAGAGQTGKLPTVAIQDLKSGDWLQAGGGSWGAGYATNNMSPNDATNLPGLYSFDLNTPRIFEKADGESSYEGFIAKIEEATTSLLEYVKIEIDWDPKSPYHSIGGNPGRTVDSILEAFYRIGLTAGDVETQVGIDALAATDLSVGKFYQNILVPGDSSKYVDRFAVLHDLDGGAENEATWPVRIGGIANDGGGNFITLLNADGTTFNNGFSGTGTRLFITQQELPVRVHVIETDVITAAALATSASEDIADKVWDEDIIIAHNGVDEAGGILGSLKGHTAASTAFAVWEQTLAAHTTGGTFGGELTPASLAAAVWLEVIAPHVAAGTAAEALSAAGGGLTADAIADAVWDEALVDHVNPGSIGKQLILGAGLNQLNHRIKNPSYDTEGRLLGCELHVYKDSTDAGLGTGELVSITVTATYDLDGNLDTFLAQE